MTIRDLDPNFLNAMRHKMQSGRESGKVGWDRKWEDTVFPTNDPVGYLLDCLNHEILELAIAIDQGVVSDILYEAADVANFAMMIADITDALED